MVKYVINRYKHIINDDILDAIAEMDNLAIYKLLTPKNVESSFINMLLKYYSYNIIEYIRFSVNDRIRFEQVLLNRSFLQQNQYLIDYFQEHDYEIIKSFKCITKYNTFKIFCIYKNAFSRNVYDITRSL